MPSLRVFVDSRRYYRSPSAQPDELVHRALKIKPKIKDKYKIIVKIKGEDYNLNNIDDDSLLKILNDENRKIFLFDYTKSEFEDLVKNDSDISYIAYCKNGKPIWFYHY